MELIKKIFLIIMFIFSFGYLYSDENILRFSDIVWETSPEQVILIEGIPDVIYYNYGDDAKSFYDDNGVKHRTVVEVVWINSNVNDNDLLEYAINKNIPIGIDIERIIDGYNNISFRYNNFSFFKYNSTIFLTFEDKKFVDISYIIHTDNLTIDEKNDMVLYIQNYYFQLYGVPEGTSYDKIEDFSIWRLNDTLVFIHLFLPENYPDSKYNYVDMVSVFYGYIKE